MFKPFDLTGKVALITGGNGGIGLGMAQGLAQAGASVAIWGRSEEKNQKAEQQLKQDSDKVLSLKVDVADEKALIEAFGQTIEHFGRIDSIFANAGVSGAGSSAFADMATADYRKVLAVNLDGVFWTLREGSKHMVARAKKGDGGGSLVGVASLAAIEGAARTQPYAATKGAVVSMIKGCAVELARYDVRANSILPGWIATDMTKGAQDSSVFQSKVISRVPARRWGAPEDFAGVAVYLASDASRYHSGDSFIVDGGYAIF
jgi:NAD(P)-dependent dehydrogenase (short-subunit alcohol dehydrogenase family)